jgi:hypothetical protein
MKTLIHKNHNWAPLSKYEFWKMVDFSEKLERVLKYWTGW